MSRPRVALIDSGIGGLSLIQSIRSQHPHIDLIYGNDNAHFPYGPKPEKDVVEYVMAFVSALHQREAFDALVIGCNTASTVALPSVRASVIYPVVGVVPAIKPAATMTTTGHIGLLATEGTIKRSYTADLIQQFARECQVHLLGSNRLVQIAEAKIRGESIDAVEIKEIVAPFIEHPIDVLVLGCTHFPFLSDELSEAMGVDCTLIDSGEAIARRTAAVLGMEEDSKPDDVGDLHAYFSKASGEIETLRPALSEMGFSRVEFL